MTKYQPRKIDGCRDVLGYNRIIIRVSKGDGMGKGISIGLSIRLILG